MKIEMMKFAGGLLSPVNDMELEKLTRFKTGEQYTIDIKLTRDPKFHAKVFLFFHFCFEHWDADACFEYLDKNAQFDEFRSALTILAGYTVDTWHPFTGELKQKAKSLSFGNMEQEEFEQCYHALIQAAMKHVFKTMDDNTYNQLIGFF